MTPDIEPCSNFDCPVLEVYHADLTRDSDESPFRSRCPTCQEGVLLVSRGLKGHLTRYDCCILCGQRVKYLDERIAGEKVVEEVADA